jgi:hypothetical protein
MRLSGVPTYLGAEEPDIPQAPTNDSGCNRRARRRFHGLKIAGDQFRHSSSMSSRLKIESFPRNASRMLSRPGYWNRYSAAMSLVRSRSRIVGFLTAACRSGTVVCESAHPGQSAELDDLRDDIASVDHVLNDPLPGRRRTARSSKPDRHGVQRGKSNAGPC